MGLALADLAHHLELTRTKSHIGGNMRKVITGSLNGNAYQFEEQAFDVVRTYLDRAAAGAADSPDRAEILADLEQAIADKCDTFLGKHKNVISLDEARQILREMGPVQDSASGPGVAQSAAGRASASDPLEPPRARRLYRIPSEGMLGGVCAGLAAYVGIDAVWMRLIYVLLTCTTGVWFFVWLVQLWITPRASSPQEIATAQGMQGAIGG
jgi:phage shock protein PspC (stress-responsive transcriptional regulator)